MSKKDVQKSDEAVIDFVNRNWESFGEFAYECYVLEGRGAIVAEEKDDLIGVLEREDYAFVVAGKLNSEVAPQLRSYDPHNEIIIVIQRPTDEQSCLRISTPSGRLTPAAACYEVYRDAHGPLDFQWLMNNHHQSDQFGQHTDEHRAEVQASLKPAMQNFLGALRLNLKAFLTTGLELEELCPNVFYGGDSCADRLVLNSAHKDGVLRIDDSHCKRRWKPGPEWAKLEGLLS